MIVSDRFLRGGLERLQRNLFTLRSSSGGHERPGTPLEYLLRVENIQQLDEFCNNPSPAGLVAGAKSSAIVAMEILIEKNIIAPVRVGLEFFGTAVYRPPTLFVPEKDAGEPPGNIHGHLEEVHHAAGTRRTFDFEAVAIIQVEL